LLIIIFNTSPACGEKLHFNTAQHNRLMLCFFAVLHALQRLGYIGLSDFIFFYVSIEKFPFSLFFHFLVVLYQPFGAMIVLL
jgi:hypothetical protein